MGSISQAPSPWYTREQLLRYYDRISLPSTYHDHDAIQYLGEPSAIARHQEFINVLMQHHLASIPFENLELHYSRLRVPPSLNTQHIFSRFVEDGRGKGGSSMQHNAFFCTVLTSLGFRVWPTGARMFGITGSSMKTHLWQDPRTTNWNHLVLILTLDHSRYLIDVGMGHKSTIFPVPLTSGLTLPSVLSIETQLLHAPIPGVLDSNERRWLSRLRYRPSDPWTDIYAFTEAEFLPDHFEVFGACLDEFEDTTVFCSRMVMEGGEITGEVFLRGKDVKRRGNGSIELLETFDSEDQRVHGLERHFGVLLTPEERDGIHGTSSELRV